MKWLTGWLLFAAYVSAASATVLYHEELHWAFDEATGPVANYECEDSTGRTTVAAFGDFQWEPTESQDYAIRCRGVTETGEGGPWSEWSEAKSVRCPDADNDGDCYVGAEDFGILSIQYGAHWIIEP